MSPRLGDLEASRTYHQSTQLVSDAQTRREQDKLSLSRGEISTKPGGLGDENKITDLICILPAREHGYKPDLIISGITSQ